MLKVYYCLKNAGNLVEIYKFNDLKQELYRKSIAFNSISTKIFFTISNHISYELLPLTMIGVAFPWERHKASEVITGFFILVQNLY